MACNCTKYSSWSCQCTKQSKNNTKQHAATIIIKKKQQQKKQANWNTANITWLVTKQNIVNCHKKQRSRMTTHSPYWAKLLLSRTNQAKVQQYPANEVRCPVRIVANSWKFRPTLCRLICPKVELHFIWGERVGGGQFSWWKLLITLLSSADSSC